VISFAAPFWVQTGIDLRIVSWQWTVGRFAGALIEKQLANVRLALPVQTVDATPSSVLIR
jgi:hypothetical protein